MIKLNYHLWKPSKDLVIKIPKPFRSEPIGFGCIKLKYDRTVMEFKYIANCDIANLNITTVKSIFKSCYEKSQQSFWSVISDLSGCRNSPHQTKLRPIVFIEFKSITWNCDIANLNITQRQFTTSLCYMNIQIFATYLSLLQYACPWDEAVFQVLC